MMSSRVAFISWRGGIGSYQFRDSSSSRGGREMRTEIQMDPARLKTFQTFQHHGIFIPTGTTSAHDFRRKGRVWALWEWKGHGKFGIWDHPSTAVSHLSNSNLHPLSTSSFPHFHLSLLSFLPTTTQAQLSPCPINPRKTPAFSTSAARLPTNKSVWD